MSATQDVSGEVRFRTRSRGYDRDEVGAYVRSVRQASANAVEQIRQLQLRISQLEAGKGQGGEVSELRDTLVRTLVLAQRSADGAIAEARTSAQETLENAQRSAEQTTSAAEATAAEQLKAARDEVQRLQSESEENCNSMLAEAKHAVGVEIANEREKWNDELRKLEQTKAELEASCEAIQVRIKTEQATMQRMLASLQSFVNDITSLSETPTKLVTKSLVLPPVASKGDSTDSTARRAASPQTTRRDGTSVVEQPDSKRQQRTASEPRRPLVAARGQGRQATGVVAATPIEPKQPPSRDVPDRREVASKADVTKPEVRWRDDPDPSTTAKPDAAKGSRPAPPPRHDRPQPPRHAKPRSKTAQPRRTRKSRREAARAARTQRVPRGGPGTSPAQGMQLSEASSSTENYASQVTQSWPAVPADAPAVFDVDNSNEGSDEFVEQLRRVVRDDAPVHDSDAAMSAFFGKGKASKR